MKRKVLVVGVAVLTAILVGRFVLEPIWVEAERRLIEHELSEALGLAVEIRGDLRLGYIPRFRFEATDVTLANLPGRSSPHLAEVGTLAMEVGLRDLVRGEVEIHRLWVHDARLWLEAGPEGRKPLAHRLHSLTNPSEDEEFDFRVGEVEFVDLRLSYDPRDGGAIRSVQLDHVSLRADDFESPLYLEVVGEIDGQGLDVSARFGSLPELLAPSAPYPFSVRAAFLDAEIEVEGTARAPRSLRGLDAAFTATLPDLALLFPRSRRKLAAIGPLQATARLTDRDGALGADDLLISSAHGAPGRIELTGSVRDLVALRGVDLRLRLEAEDTSALDAPSFLLKATSAAEAVRAESDETDVRVVARARDLSVVGRALASELPLPAIGPVSVTASLRDRDDALGLDDLKLEVGQRDASWVEIRGSIRDVLSLEGVRLLAEFGLADLQHLKPYIQDELPDVGPFGGEATVTDLDGTLGVERFSLRGGREGFFEIHVSGEVDHLRDFDEITLDTKLAATDLGVAGDVFGLDLPPIGPMEFSGSVTGSDEWIVSKGTALLGETFLRGTWSGSFAPGSRPRLEARLESEHVRLRDVAIDPSLYAAESVAAAGAAARRVAADRWWSGAEPLPLEPLRALDAEIDLHTDRLTGRRGFDAADTRMSLWLEDGQLRIKQGRIGYEGGTLEFELRADVRSPVPVLALRTQAQGVDLTTLMDQLEVDTQSAGRLDAKIDVEGRGSSRDEIRSSLAGSFEATLREGSLAFDASRAFVKNLARASLPALRAPELPRFNCIGARFEIEDGVAHAQALLLVTSDVTITGEGRLDIGGDAWDLRLTPEVRDPALLSTAATVDVTGPLADPEFEPVRRSLATSSARALISNALRPARTLLRPFRGNRDDDGDPCAPAMRPSPEP